jgi:hypothetical protein
VASAPVAAAPGGARRAERDNVGPAGQGVGGSPAVIQHHRRRDRDAEREQDQRGEQRQHRPAQPAQPLRRGAPLGHRAGPGDPAAAAAERALAGQHQQAEQDEHQGQRAGGGEAVPVEFGEDLGRERLVAEDLERAELGQQDERDQQAAAEDRALGLAERDPGEGSDATDPEAAGHLLLAGIGDPQAGRHRQVDQRVHGEGHHDGRAGEAVRPGPQRVPAEAHHEVGDGQRDDDEYRPDAAAGQVGALDAPRRTGPDHRAGRRDHRGEPDRVPQQGRRVTSGRPALQLAGFPPAPAASISRKTSGPMSAATRMAAVSNATGREVRRPALVPVACWTSWTSVSRVTAGRPAGAGRSLPRRRRAGRS